MHWSKKGSYLSNLSTELTKIRQSSQKNIVIKVICLVHLLLIKIMFGEIQSVFDTGILP